MFKPCWKCNHCNNLEAKTEYCNYCGSFSKDFTFTMVRLSHKRKNIKWWNPLSWLKVPIIEELKKDGTITERYVKQ